MFKSYEKCYEKESLKKLYSMKTYQALEIAKSIAMMAKEDQIKAVYDLAMSIRENVGAEIIEDLSVTYNGKQKADNALSLTYTGSI